MNTTPTPVTLSKAEEAVLAGEKIRLQEEEQELRRFVAKARRETPPLATVCFGADGFAI